MFCGWRLLAEHGRSPGLRETSRGSTFYDRIEDGLIGEAER